MTINDAEVLIEQIQANYPNFYTRQTAKQAEQMINLWAAAFMDYDRDIVAKGLMAVIMRKNDFPPTVAEVNNEVRKMLRPETDTVGGEDAWERVLELVRYYPLSQPFGSWSQENQEKFGNMLLTDPILSQTYTKKALSSIGGWMTIGCCQLEDLSFLRNSFVKTYNELLSRETAQAMIPPTLTAEIAAIREQHLPQLPRMAGEIIQIADKLKASGTDYIPGEREDSLAAIGSILKMLRAEE
jgi:hypothetical protein